MDATLQNDKEKAEKYKSLFLQFLQRIWSLQESGDGQEQTLDHKQAAMKETQHLTKFDIIAYVPGA